MKEMKELCPLAELSQQQLEELAVYGHPFTQANQERITARFNQKVAQAGGKGRKRRVGTAILLAAAFAALLVGFTNMGRINRLFSAYFGTGQDLSQYAAEIGESTVDQGIRIEVLAAVNDGENTYLFVELSDEQERRLAADLFVDNWDLRGGRNMGGGNCRLVEFDEATGTAVLAVHAIGGRPGKDAVFSLESFFTDKVRLDFTSDLDLAGLLREFPGSFTLRNQDEGFGGGYGQEFIDAGYVFHELTDVLESNIEVRIPGYEKGYLSAIGYRDGMLYVQMNPDNDKGNEALMLSLRHRETGEELNSFYSMSYGVFERDGVQISNEYQEAVFRIAQEDLQDYRLHLSGWYYNKVVEGNWAVAFTVPEQAKARQPIILPVELEEGVEVASAYLSHFGLTLDLKYTGLIAEAYPVNINLLYQDGTRKEFHSSELSIWEGEQESHLQVVRPIDALEKITAIEINGVTIPLE